MMEVVSGDSWSYKPCLARAKSSPPTIILKLWIIFAEGKVILISFLQLMFPAPIIGRYL